MESSIAKFLWRQPACERLPTIVGRASLGSNLSKDSWLLQTRLRATGATARREGACFGVSLRHRGAPCLRRLSAPPEGAPARGRGACLAVARRHAGAVVAPSLCRPGAGGWSGFQPDRAHKPEIWRGECGRRISTAPWCNGSTLVSKSSCRGSIPRGAPLSKCAGLRCAIGGFLREVPVVNLPG